MKINKSINIEELKKYLYLRIEQNKKNQIMERGWYDDGDPEKYDAVIQELQYLIDDINRKEKTINKY